MRATRDAWSFCDALCWPASVTGKGQNDILSISEPECTVEFKQKKCHTWVKLCGDDIIMMSSRWTTHPDVTHLCWAFIDKLIQLHFGFFYQTVFGWWEWRWWKNWGAGVIKSAKTSESLCHDLSIRTHAGIMITKYLKLSHFWPPVSEYYILPVCTVYRD